MSRRSGGGGGGGVRRSASPTPKREPSLQPPRRQQSSFAPANVPTAVPSTQKPQSPSLLGQVAATAGGVAIGSAVGHVAGAAITGAIGGGHQTHAAKTAEPAAQPCSLEITQFLKCASDSPEDLNACQEFNEAMQRCRLRNNLVV